MKQQMKNITEGEAESPALSLRTLNSQDFYSAFMTMNIKVLKQQRPP